MGSRPARLTLIVPTAALALLATLSASPAAAAPTTTTRISVSTSAAQVHRAVTLAVPGISDDGRFVLMTSPASGLVAGDTNGVSDAFVRDTQANTTRRVSVSSSGRQGDGASTADAISPNGRYVVFTSRASNLSVARDTNGVADVFIRDRTLGITRRVSVPPAGGQFHGASTGVSVSGNGRDVLFSAEIPSEGERTFVRDRALGTTTRIARHAGVRDVQAAGMSANGRMVAWDAVGEKLGVCSAVIHDRVTGRNFSYGYSDGYGCCSGPVLFTPDGSKAVFSCVTSHGAGPLAAILWTRAGITQITPGTSDTVPTGITDDGGEVSVISYSDTLVSGDTNAAPDLFALTVGTGTASRLDLSSSGAQIGAGTATDPFTWSGGQISGDGQWAAFASAGGSVVPGDTNGTVDVFLRGPLP